MTRVGSVAAAVVLLTGCPSGDEPADETTRDSKIYVATISELADQFQIIDPIPDREPVLYVESFDADGVPLQVQVDVVAEFLDVYDVRFVDEREEALDDEFVRLPVRRGGVLVGLSPIVEGTNPTLRVELYADLRDVRAYQYTVAELDDGQWGVVGAPEPVAPQGFVTE
ncbi:MAG: hypothetical protein HKN94_14965 [Acidimicrobiales bacterium]|nr:hypothetical protein [Acidimicrobiales bacterium]